MALENVHPFHLPTEEVGNPEGDRGSQKHKFLWSPDIGISKGWSNVRREEMRGGKGWFPLEQTFIDIHEVLSSRCGYL